MKMLLSLLIFSKTTVKSNERSTFAELWREFAELSRLEMQYVQATVGSTIRCHMQTHLWELKKNTGFENPYFWTFFHLVGWVFFVGIMNLRKPRQST